MNRLFKSTFLTLTLSITLAVFVCVPFVVHAEGDGTGGEQKKTTKEEVRSEFCSKFDSKSTTISKEVDSRKSKVDKARVERNDKFGSVQTKWAQKVSEFRTKEDQRREENFKVLDSNAKTDEQKAAVSIYKEAVLAAVSARQAGHEANQKTFVDGVNATTASHRVTVDGQRSTFTSAVSTALANAKASCVAGSSADEVKTKLQADLKVAKENYKTARKSDDKVKNKIKELNEQRKAADKKVNETFKTATQEAREVLKKVFSDDRV